MTKEKSTQKLRAYKINLLKIIDVFVEKCETNELREEKQAFLTVRRLIEKDIINDTLEEEIKKYD